MRRRKWDANTKARLVIAGLKGKPVAEICPEHQIRQGQYDQWRDPGLAHAPIAVLDCIYGSGLLCL
jgi:Transposase